jgi:hypothetical protein
MKMAWISELTPLKKNKKPAYFRLVPAMNYIAKRETGFEPATFSLARIDIKWPKERAVTSNYERLLSTFTGVKTARESDVTLLIVSDLSAL